MDDELDRLHAPRRQSYWACWLGFSIFALNYATTTLVSSLEITLLIAVNNPNLGRLLGIEAFDLHFDSIRVWARLIGALALAGAWPGDRAWRRRAGLLATMTLGDIVLWATIEAVPLGLAPKPSQYLILCTYLRMALSWSRFLLIASLASDLAGHAGAERAESVGVVTRRTSTIGAAVWFAYFLVRIDWSRPWPLAERPMGPEAIQLWMVSVLMLLASLAQASLLTLLAAGASWRLLREADREASTFDPWAEPPPAS